VRSTPRDSQPHRRLRSKTPQVNTPTLISCGTTSLRTVAPLASDPRNVIAVGDVSVPDLGGRFVERRLDRENLAQAGRLALDGVLAPVITAVHPLSDAPAALATVENGHTSGKVVIKVA
jgi:NADPH2:quinone reductase